jgi:hypothetical protein
MSRLFPISQSTYTRERPAARCRAESHATWMSAFFSSSHLTRSRCPWGVPGVVHRILIADGVEQRSVSPFRFPGNVNTHIDYPPHLSGGPGGCAHIQLLNEGTAVRPAVGDPGGGLLNPLVNSAEPSLIPRSFITLYSPCQS